MMGLQYLYDYLSLIRGGGGGKTYTSKARIMRKNAHFSQGFNILLPQQASVGSQIAK
jgi:hypothetical protein